MNRIVISSLFHFISFHQSFYRRRGTSGNCHTHLSHHTTSISRVSKTLIWGSFQAPKAPISKFMDSDSWTRRLSAATKRYQSALQSRSDLHLGFEEVDVDDDSRAEFACPFCAEDFDIIGLCCHIDDEHPVEAKNGVCPVCGMRVGTNMVGHITMQHGQFFKMQRRRRIRKIGSHSTLSLLRKELREGNLQSLLGGSYVSSSNAEPDPLLSSFVYNLPLPDEPTTVQTHPSAESSLAKKSSDEKVIKSVKPPPLSHKEQEEKTRRCEFVQELLLSTIFDDTL